MKIKEFLLEYNRDITKQKIGDKLSVAGQRDRNVDIDTILQTLEDIDPTPNKQYVLWLANQYMKNLFRLEDKNRVKDVLEKFMQVKSRLPEKDIGRYTFHSLEEKMDELFNVQLTTKPVEPEQQTFQVPKGVKVLYNGPLGLLAIPLSYKASCILGSGTKWCTAATGDPVDARNIFLDYTENGPLYIWRDKNGEKYQFHFDWKNIEFQFMNSKDRDIPEKILNYFRNEHPVLKKMFEKEEKKATMIALNAKAHNWKKFEYYINDILYNYIGTYNQRIPWFEKLMLSKIMLFDLNTNSKVYNAWVLLSDYLRLTNIVFWPEYFEKLLNSTIKYGSNNTKEHAIYHYLENGPKKRNQKVEKLILQLISKGWHNVIISLYTEKVGRWPKIENYLLKNDLDASIEYATKVLQRRWPELETKLVDGNGGSLLVKYKNSMRKLQARKKRAEKK